MTTFTEADEGKVLVDAEGEKLGLVIDVRDDVAYVDPDPGLGEAALAAFGRADRDGDEITVEGDVVEAVTDKEVRLVGDV